MRDEVKTREELLAELASQRKRLKDFDRLETELEKCRKDLSEIELNYHLVTENAKDVIWLWDIQANQFIYVSPSVYRIRGYSVEEVKKQKLLDSLPPEAYWLLEKELPGRIALLEAGDESARLKSYEMCQTRSDGSLLPTEVSTTLITDADGNVTHLQGITRDVTEQKKAELSLRESEERYRNLFEKNNAVMLLLDSHNGSIVDANISACNFYGWMHHEMLEMKINNINILTQEEILMEMKCAREQKRNHFFFKHRLADGSIRDVEVFNGPIHFQERDLVYSIIYDVTDHKLIEEELNRARKLESVGVLAGGIAHDFNNLLAAIQGFIELSRMDIAPEHKAQQKLGIALDAVVQATDLTKQLITFSKGGAPLFSACNIAELVRTRLQKMKILSAVQTVVEADNDLWTVDLDKGQIGQVIANITENAVEAMPDGGIITLRLENATIERQEHLPIAEGQYVRVTISDTGSGIAENDMPHIFDPYYSTKQRGRQKGMGLGLAVCHSIINRHKGCIRAYSGEGKGATFQIHIPRRSLDSTLEISQSIRKDTIVNKKIKVLLLDDETSVRDMTSALLNTMGYDVTAISDGLDAIAEYTQSVKQDLPFDLLLLDLTVKGGMGGVLTLQRILEINPKAKAIVFSGYTDDPVIENYRNYGFLDAITKPFTAETLKTIIEKHC